MQELPLKHMFNMIKLTITSNFHYYQTMYKIFSCSLCRKLDSKPFLTKETWELLAEKIMQNCKSITRNCFFKKEPS